MRITPAEITALILSVKVALLSRRCNVSSRTAGGMAPGKTGISRQNLPQYGRDVTVGATTCGKWVFTPYPLG